MFKITESQKLSYSKITLISGTESQYQESERGKKSFVLNVS